MIEFLKSTLGIWPMGPGSKDEERFCVYRKTSSVESALAGMILEGDIGVDYGNAYIARDAARSGFARVRKVGYSFMGFALPAL